MNCVTHLSIFGDGYLIARVFENLLVNAIRYGYEGKYVDINGFVEDSNVVVQVVNYGDRIPNDKIPHIFDVFYTGDKARTYKENSTGLGLFIAKNIIEQHHGTISAESNLIQTTFEVRLPQGSTSNNKKNDKIQ